MKTYNTVAIVTDINGVDSNEELTALFARALELCQTAKNSQAVCPPSPSHTQNLSSEGVTYCIQHAESVNLTPIPLPEIDFQECLHGMQAVIRHITHTEDSGMEKAENSGHTSVTETDNTQHGYKETSSLNRHLTICPAEEIVKCCECDKVYTSQEDFNQHTCIKSYEGGTAAVEGKKVVDESKVMGKHTKAQLNCTICGKIYTSQGPFKKHFAKHHAETHSSVLKDSGGDENQETMQDAHIGEHNTFEKAVAVAQDHVNQHKCQICNKTFKTNSYLLEHMRIHTGERPHKCQLCTMAFVNKGNLNKHIQIHTGERRHKCDFCDQAFIGKYDIVRHMRIHTGERPHKCEFCDKGFIRKQHLLRHVSTHTNERPHKCDSCDKAFKMKADLVSHFQIHTGKRPHKCEVCSKAFIRKQHLIVHLRTHTERRPTTLQQNI